LGLPIIVDGVFYGAEAGTVVTTPCAAGSQHTASIDTSALSNISGPRIRYSFAGWNDGIQSTSRQITCPQGTTTYTAIINVQYRLTITATPAGTGSIDANPASPDGFYSSGASVQLAASTGFVSWSGDLSGSANPQAVLMNGPKSITANFEIAPQRITAVPSSGMGSTQAFTFTFPGVSNVASVNVLIGPAIAAVGSCYFIYQPPFNQVDLVDDTGTNLLQLSPGDGSTLSNSQCSIPASSVSVAMNGNDLIFSATVSFASAFLGPKTIWATWYSNNIMQGDWQTIGSWSVVPSITAAPSSGAGNSQAFTFTFPGVSNVGSVNVLFGSSLTGAGSCYFIYEPPANRVDLVDDAGMHLLQLSPGDGSTLSNSQCSIPAPSVSVAMNGNDLIFSATVTFASAFLGPKTIWATWYSNNIMQGDWQTIGAWAVP
jgi:hypothetical protein